MHPDFRFILGTWCIAANGEQMIRDSDAMMIPLLSQWDFEERKYHHPPRELIAVVCGLRAKGYDRQLWPRTQISPGPIGKPTYRFSLSRIPWTEHRPNIDPWIAFRWADDSGLSVTYTRGEDFLWLVSPCVEISADIEAILARLLAHAIGKTL